MCFLCLYLPWMADSSVVNTLCVHVLIALMRSREPIKNIAIAARRRSETKGKRTKHKIKTQTNWNKKSVWYSRVSCPIDCVFGLWKLVFAGLLYTCTYLPSQYIYGCECEDECVCLIACDLCEARDLRWSSHQFLSTEYRLVKHVNATTIHYKLWKIEKCGEKKNK